MKATKRDVTGNWRINYAISPSPENTAIKAYLRDGALVDVGGSGIGGDQPPGRD